MTGHIAARRLAVAALNVPCRRTLSQSAARPFSAAWDLASPSTSSSAPAAESSRQASNATASGTTTPPTISQASASALPPKSAEASSVPFDAIPPPASSPSGETAPHDWSRSFHGLSAEPFPKEVADVLLAPIDPNDIEIKPDGLIYLPEIKYRRILNRAFGPGGWGLAPRGETNIGNKIVSREYALVCLGRLVGVARGEQEYFDPSGVATATEGCKSNALMRTCKDLGIGSELWDPRFISKFKAKYGVEVWAEHVVTKKKRKLWRRKDDKLSSPYEEKK